MCCSPRSAIRCRSCRARDCCFCQGFLPWTRTSSCSGTLFWPPAIWNTLFYVVVGTIVSVVLTTLGAWVFAAGNGMGHALDAHRRVYHVVQRRDDFHITCWCGTSACVQHPVGTYASQGDFHGNLIIMRTAFQSVPVVWESAELDAQRFSNHGQNHRAAVHSHHCGHNALLFGVLLEFVV